MAARWRWLVWIGEHAVRVVRAEAEGEALFDFDLGKPEYRAQTQALLERERTRIS